MTDLHITDWVEHDGKSLPVDGDEFVLVRIRDGYETQRPMPAKWFDNIDVNLSDWRWPSLSPECEIIAYRTVTPIKEWAQEYGY